MALDTPLVEVGLHDNESLSLALSLFLLAEVRHGEEQKRRKSILTIVRISVGDREVITGFRVRFLGLSLAS